MNREEFAEKIRWPIWFSAAGIINITAMLPQVWTLLQTKSSQNIAPGMIWIYLGVQICFAFHGFVKRDKIMMITLALAALVSIVTLVLVYVYR